MTDILDLEGWNVVAKRVDGDDYLIEAEYTVPPKACTKCGNIGNLYKHGPKPITIRDSPIRGRPVRMLLPKIACESVQPVTSVSTRRVLVSINHLTHHNPLSHSFLDTRRDARHSVRVVCLVF